METNNIASKLYQHSLENRYHISVGVVLFNDAREILVHKYELENIPDQFKFLAGGLDSGYTLMRESLESDEPLPTAVVRGLHEEFGMEAVVERFLGSIECEVDMQIYKYEKTTLYHAAKVIGEIGKRSDSAENVSTLEWKKPTELYQLLLEQEKLTARVDLHEAEIIKRFISAYGL